MVEVGSLLDSRGWVHPKGPVERVFGINEGYSGGRVQCVHCVAGSAASTIPHRYDLHQADGCGTAHCEFHYSAVVMEGLVKRSDNRRGGTETFSVSSDQRDMLTRLMEAT